MNLAPELISPNGLRLPNSLPAHEIVGIEVSDVDDGLLSVSITAAGSMSLATIAGLTFITGDGVDDSEMEFSGSVAALNTALATLTYSSGVDATDMLTITVKDGHIQTLPGEFTVQEPLSGLTSDTGIRIHGFGEDAFSGSAVSSAGDVNGDGLDDIIIGARYADADGELRAGQAYVVFGTTQSFNQPIELSDLDGLNGFTINGSDRTQFVGWSVSGAGDVNADGIDDLLVGAMGASPNDIDAAGQAFVIFGTTDGFAPQLFVTDLDGTNGFTLNGDQYIGHLGLSLSSIGDANGDGIADMLIGAPDASEAYLLFGSSTGFSSDLNISDLNGQNGVTLDGISFSASGYSVSEAGDFNNDGLDDLLIGAYLGRVDGDRVGQTFVVFGSTSWPATMSFSTLDGSNGFVFNGLATDDGTGYTVSSAGDVNDDGIDDLIIGAFAADPNGESRAGVTYVVFGTTAPMSAAFDLSSLDGQNGFVLTGDLTWDYSGAAVHALGDINADGIDDIAIGAYYADASGNADSGATYIVFGSSAGFAAQIDLTSLDGTSGFKLNGAASGDWSGYAVSEAGDFNGDGLADFLTGSPNADPNGTSNAGTTYLLFGRQQRIENAVTANISIELFTPFRDFDLSGTTDLLFQMPGAGSFFRLNDPASGSLPSNEARPDSTSMGFADIDGDGILDHVMKGANRAHIVQFGADNDTSQNIGRGNSMIAGFADIDGDGEAEAFAQSLNPNVSRLFLLDDQFGTITNLRISDQTLKGFGDF
ncbi:MAG: hypothetical protein CMK07_03950, partial [Ponticaulis sp.]|nr:hypothetical protein [Ponticaulis sp.]